MIVFKDLLSGDELFSDAYKYKELEGGVFLEVEGKVTEEKDGISDAAIGGNKSAEDNGCEEVEDAGTRMINIVRSNRLEEVSCFTKKDYKAHIKKYCCKIITKLEEEGKKTPEEIKAIKAATQEAIKHQVFKVLNDYHCDFFRGEDPNPCIDDGECMLVLVHYRDGVPYLWFFKHGLEEERL